MPFPRKKLKIVTDGSSGRDITSWRNSSCNLSYNEEYLDADASHSPPAEHDGGGGNGPNVIGEDDTEGEFSLSDARENSGRQTYAQIKSKDIESWRKLRQQFLHVAIARSGFPASVKCCLVCHSATFSQTSSQQTLYRCSDCGPFYYVCFSCLVEDHKLRPHHIPEVWNGHYFEAFPLHDVEKPVEIPIHACMSKYKRILKVANSTGQVQEMWVVFCACEPEAITLLKLDLWPSSSKKPTTAYHIDLLRSLRALMLECHVSVLGYTNAMRWKNDISKQQASSLYRLLVNESFEEFRHFVYQLDTYREICPAVDDGSACMLCPKEKGKIVLMIDGTFGCVRKSSSGKSIEGPKHANRLFLDQSSVDNFVDSHSADSKNIQLDCSSFKAGKDNFHSNIQRKKLDVFGIFGCSCKHEIPKCFLNMKHGERLAYPIYLLQKIMEPYKTNGIDFYVIYDIACLLSKHIKKNGLEDQFSTAFLATPDWHAYGHIAACQIEYAVRFLPAVGLTDGEGCERLWSYVRQFTAITKEMTDSHRIDLLTDGLLYYSKRKNGSMEIALLERWKKAESLLKSSKEELDHLQHSSSERFDDTTIKHWYESEKAALSRIQSSKRKNQQWTEEYVNKLISLSEARDMLRGSNCFSETKQLQSQIKGLEQETKAIERKNGVETRWRKQCDEFCRTFRAMEDNKKIGLLAKARSEATERMFHLSLKRKYSVGQTLPKRIEKMIQKSAKCLNRTIQSYNESGFTSRSRFPNTVTFTELKDPEGPVYQSLDPEVEFPNSLPSSVRRKAVSLLFIRDRASDELQQVSSESLELNKYLDTRLKIIRDCITQFQGHPSPSELTRGSIAMLYKHAKHVEQRITCVHKLFSELVPSLAVEERDFSPWALSEEQDMEILFDEDETEKMYDEQLLQVDLEEDGEETLEV